MLWSWAAAESTGRQFQTAWQTAVSHSNNNPRSQWKRAKSVRAAQPEHQQWKQEIRGRSELMAQVSGPPVSGEPFRRAPMQKHWRGIADEGQHCVSPQPWPRLVFVGFFWCACIHAGFIPTYESSKACRETSVFDISFFHAAGWLSF